MTPEIETLKMQKTDLELENQLLKFDNKMLYAENKRLFWVLFGFIILFGIMQIAFAGLTQTKYNLGRAVLNSGVCVEMQHGFSCETPDNTTFIAK